MKPPPKTRPFLALCKNYQRTGKLCLWTEVTPTWKEVYWVDGRFSLYSGKDRVWSTDRIEILTWIECPSKAGF